MAPGDVNDGARALEGILARWQKDTNGSLVSAGSSNAYTLAINSSDTLYDGQVFVFDANHANTGAATLNVTNFGGAAQGATAIVKRNDIALASGDIEANQKVTVVYDGTSFQMLSPAAQVGVGDLKAAWIGDLGTATVATGDLVPVGDVDDSNNQKRVTAQSIADLNAGVTQAVQAAIEAETNEDTYIPPDLLKHSPGVAVAHGNMNGTGTPAFNGTAYNFSSVTDNAAGKQKANFTNSLSNATYTVATAGNNDGTGANENANVSVQTLETDGVTIWTVEIGNTAAAFADRDNVGITVHGDFA